MTAAAVAVPRVVSRTRVTDFFFFATFFCVTFEKVHWNVAGTVGIADVRGHSNTILGTLVARQADAVVTADDLEELASVLRSLA